MPRRLLPWRPGSMTHARSSTSTSPTYSPDRRMFGVAPRVRDSLRTVDLHPGPTVRASPGTSVAGPRNRAASDADDKAKGDPQTVSPTDPSTPAGLCLFPRARGFARGFRPRSRCRSICRQRRTPVRLSLLPKKSEFFVLFEQAAQNSVEAAEALAKLFGDFTDVENKVRDIHAIEHHGDKLNHEIVRHLNETFVTPLDREDIVGLASKIDDVTDVCYDVAELVQLFKVKTIRPAAVRQAKVLIAAASEMLSMLKNLEGLKNLEPHWIKIHTLENEGDQIWREAVAEPVASGNDGIEVVN